VVALTSARGSAGKRPVAASLRLLGAQLGGADGSRTERVRNTLATMSPSLYESCLTKAQDSPTRRRSIEMMTLPSLNLVQASLERDQVIQNEKYGDHSPCKDAARFNVALPSTPQHDKFRKAYRPNVFSELEKIAKQEEIEKGKLTLNERHLKFASSLSDDIRTGSTTTPLSSRPGSTSSKDGLGPMEDGLGPMHAAHRRSARECSFPRYCVQTLEKWFKDIDEKGDGAITQRDFMTVLREKEQLHRTFCLAIGLQHPLDHESGPQQPLLRRRTTTCLLGLGTVEDRTEVRKEEKKRNKEIMAKVEWNKDRMLDYQGFLAFFSKHGMLLQ